MPVSATYKLTKVALSVLPAMAVQKTLRFVAPGKTGKFACYYSGWVNKTLGARIVVKGKPVENEACLVIANHASWQDIFFLGGTVPVCFVAKNDVAGWPVIGMLARLGGTIFVDRHNRQAAGETTRQMREKLEEGQRIALFPEGTTGDGNRLLPFKSSLFAASKMEVNGEHVKVQPVTIAYKKVWGMPMGREQRSKFAWPGTVELPGHLWAILREGPADISITFHEPTTIDETGNRKLLARHCEQVIRIGLAEELANCH